MMGDLKLKLEAARSSGWETLLENRWPAKLPRMAFTPAQLAPPGDVLIVIFLRGAADGLNIVVPHGDEHYYKSRPTLAIARPDASSVERSERVIDLDGFFGLHPRMEALREVWSAGHLGIVQACGSPEDSHSHFRAMEYMERGVIRSVGPASGWLNRHLATLENGNYSPLRGVGWGEAVPRSLQGAVPVMALRSITDAHMGGDPAAASLFRESLRVLYESDVNLHKMGEETLSVLSALESIDPSGYETQGLRDYPRTQFSQSLKQIALLIKSEIGLEVAALDLGGWDTHFAQGSAQGMMANLLSDLSNGIAAFHEDLGPLVEQVTVVVMTEFGRRVAENASLGTDHGHGGVMLLIGGGLDGSSVHARWPGLAREQLFGPGDLQVTTDYREVLSELLRLRLGNTQTHIVFPGFEPNGLGLFRPRS